MIYTDKEKRFTQIRDKKISTDFRERDLHR